MLLCSFTCTEYTFKNNMKTDKNTSNRHALIVWRRIRLKKIKLNIFSYNLMIRAAKECNAGKKIRFFKKWAISGLFYLYFSSGLQTVNKCSIKVADDWIRTWVLCYWMRSLCQLRHKHCLKIKV